MASNSMAPRKPAATKVANKTQGANQLSLEDFMEVKKRPASWHSWAVDQEDNKAVDLSPTEPKADDEALPDGKPDSRTMTRAHQYVLRPTGTWFPRGSSIASTISPTLPPSFRANTAR